MLFIAGMFYLADYLDKHQDLLVRSASEALGREVRIEDGVTMHGSIRMQVTCFLESRIPTIAGASIMKVPHDWSEVITRQEVSVTVRPVIGMPMPASTTSIRW